MINTKCLNLQKYFDLMKTLFFVLSFFIIFSCKKQQAEVQPINNDIAYLSFGEKIDPDDPISKELMADKFKSMKEGDTLSVKFSSEISEVCQAKGCWMKLDLGSQEKAMVKFKDYAFFVPLNAADKEVIVQGKAYVTKIQVKEQRHYAQDAGKSKDEIEAITEPTFTYAFEADGVLIKQ